jgi:hypothetical protein
VLFVALVDSLADVLFAGRGALRAFALVLA